MDWLLATPQINSAFSSLGSIEGDSYVVNPNALAILEEINYKLTYEDQTLRTFRRAIGFSKNVRIDLIPLLENAKDYAILDAVIRILVNLTIPVECLFSVDVMYRTEVGRLTIFELNKLLYTSKEAFTDPKSTKSVIEYMKHILESDSKLSPQKCDQINNCLLLLRNILHIPENNENFVVPASQAAGTYTVSMQNAILWNLFIQSIDKLLLYLMTCPQRAFWGVTIVQLIALIYKDQHVNTLQKLLNLWFEASLSESSEDNESNTSPPKQGSGDSSPMLTSDPTSDSSDNGSGVSKGDTTSEERRQVLREEATEATLQEVSRIGQVYQDAIHRIPADNFNDTTNSNAKNRQDYQEPMDFPKGAALSDASRHSQAPEATKETKGANKSENDEMKEYVMKMNEKEKEIKNEIEKLQIQPAERSETTTKLKSPKKIAKISNDGAFKSPLALPLKALCPPPTKEQIKVNKLETVIREEESAAPPTSQKSPHSGQLSLTKGKCCPQKRECPSSQSELSDCGYGTQVENQESISTSSNDDDSPLNKPQHQKPPCNSKPRNKQRSVLTPVDTKELRRKKLVKRSKSSLINMKGLVQHTPTDEDISNLLKEFTVDFLLKGYGHLVEELHTQLLTNMKIPIDTSHFFWLVTYFLKFAAQLELDMEHINTILTFDVISYLTYEGVTLCEQLELNAGQEGTDMKPYLRRMHLVVTAIREFLQAIETYKKVSHLSEDDRERLRRLQIQISTTEDLRCLFVLLLRNFNPSLHTKQYLQDLVVTNHILLLILDGVTKTEEKLSVNMTEHVAQFATLEIMYYYGILLEDFNNNGEFVNDCIFTMMHHIGGDLGHVGTLFQPVILKTYSRIWEADYELCDDWSDLIEYVIHKFMKTPQKSPLAMPSASLTELTKEYNSENTFCTWTQEEMDTLYWYYVQSKKATDVIGKIVKLFSNNGNKEKSRISIIQQLLQQDIINLVEYDDLMKFEDAEYQRALLTTPTSVTTESGIEAASCSKSADDIQILRDLIIKEKKEHTLVWLQKILLECCYIKLTLRTVQTASERDKLKYVMEPVAYHCILKNKSIPVVQWNAEHAATMLYQPFILLLHKLGFQLPADAGSVFVRIPDYWTPETMYNLAKKMGSLDEFLLKFDRSQLNEDADTSSTSPRCQHPHIPLRDSISSLSSFEAELTEGSDDLSLIPELEDPIMEKHSDIFALPRVKHCHSIIRYTPDPLSPPTVPNWLQLVMRSKGNSLATALSNLDKNDIDISPPDLFPGNLNQPLASPNTFSSATSDTMLRVPLAANVTSHQFLVPTSLSIPAVPTIATQLLCPSITNVIGVTNSKANDKSCNNIDQSKSLVNVARASIITTSVTTATIMTATSSVATTAPSANRIKIEHQNENVTLNETPANETEPVTPEAAVVAAANLPDDTSMKSYNRNLENEYSAMVASVYENEIANSDNASVASDLTRMYVSDEDERQEYSVTHFH